MRSPSASTSKLKQHSIVLEPSGKETFQDLLLKDPNVHVLILSKKRSSADITLRFEPTTRESSLKMEVELQERARLQVTLKLSEDVAQTSIVQHSRVGARAAFKLRNVTLGERVEQDCVCEAVGSGATSDIEWIFHAKSRDKHIVGVRNIFHKENGRGEVSLKGVAEGRSHVRCRGLVEVGVGGRGSDVFLCEDILMLDKTAKVDADPSLEIKNNDVKAGHSASIRRIHPEELFYFASRGIRETEARKMVVRGFLGNS